MKTKRHPHFDPVFLEELNDTTYLFNNGELHIIYNEELIYDEQEIDNLDVEDDFDSEEYFD